MDKIVNILLLIIVFVFDPLAISLVIAANFAFAQIKPKVKENIYGEKVVVDDDNEGTDIYTEDDLSTWDVASEDGLEEEDWKVVDEDSTEEKAPGMYYQGRRVIKTPDRTGQKWTVVLEGDKNRTKVWKKDIEFVSYRKDRDEDQTIRYM